MPLTEHHEILYPDPNKGQFDPGGDMVRLMDSVDLRFVKFHIQPEGSANPSPAREGDLLIRYAGA